MADEISISGRLRVVKGGIDITRRKNFEATMSGSAYSSNVQNIATATTGTALVVAAGVSALGWAWFQNLDATNYVEIGLQTGGNTFLPVLRLNAGEGFPVRLAQGVTHYAKANTATVNLEHTIIAN